MVGVLVGLGVIGLLHLAKLSVTFGQGTYMLAPTIAPLEVLIASVLVIGVSLLASVQPAYKASRLEPIEALRHVQGGEAYVHRPVHTGWRALSGYPGSRHRGQCPPQAG